MPGSRSSGRDLGIGRGRRKCRCPEPAGDPYDAANHPNDEAYRTEQDGQRQTVAFGESGIRECCDHAAFTDTPPSDRYWHGRDQQHRRHQEKNMRKTDRCGNCSDAAPGGADRQ